MRQGIVAEERRNEATRNLLKDADSVLSRWERMDLPSRDLRTAVAEIRRARLEFDAKLFFVVVCGPSKAGKSTLINALSRAYASPTAFGRESTLRPSLILPVHGAAQGRPDRETGIDEYFLANAPPEEKERRVYTEEVFQKVIDHLRGLVGWEAIEGFVRKQSSPLSDRAVEEKLSKPLEPLKAEPLITVIRAPGGELIREGVGILDTPGLDGIVAQGRESPVHRFLVHRSDLLILVQSSMAALSADTVRFLGEVIRASRNPPFWLVHNVIDARSWRPAEIRAREAEGQERDARRRIGGTLGVSEVPSTVMNVGKAEEGLIGRKPELLRSSGFEGFESRLREVFERERVKIQELNSLRGMAQVLDESGRRLAEALVSLQRRQTEHEGRVRSLKESLAEVERISYKEEPHSTELLKDVAALARTERSNWMMRVEDERKDLIERHESGLTGRELNRSMMKLAQAMGELGGRAYLAADGRFGDRVRERVQREMQRAEAEALSRITEALAWLPLPTLPSTTPGLTEKMPRVESVNLPALRVPERRFLIFPKRYRGAEVAAHLKRLVDEHIAVELTKRTDAWLGSFAKEYFGMVCDDRRNTLRRHLSNVRDAYESRMENEIATVRKTMEGIDALQQGIATLRPAARGALQAFE